MTIRFRKKVTRQRGSSSHGWGSKKKHRGGGSQGGRGLSGRHKHKYSYVVTKEPDYFGFKGFTSIKKKENAINIDDMQKLLKKSGISSSSQRTTSSAELLKGTENTIDLAAHGYTKLLSRGSAKMPLTVKAMKFSAKAKEKIEAAGGKIIS